MKTLLMTFLLAMMAGCASNPSPQVLAAARRYQSVDRRMGREEVLRRLGPPQSVLPDGRERWQVSDAGGSAEILLRFGPDGGITEMEGHFPIQP